MRDQFEFLGVATARRLQTAAGRFKWQRCRNLIESLYAYSPTKKKSGLRRSLFVRRINTSN
ncbi:hypothetical protein [Duganella levis]|nr:hypothetical protein [Duganella levis]